MLRSAASEFAEQLATISLTVFAFLAFSPKTIAEACCCPCWGQPWGEAVSCGCSFVLYRLHVRRFKSPKNRPVPAGKSHSPHYSSQHPEPCRPECSFCRRKPTDSSGPAKMRATATAALAQYGMLQGMVMPMLFFPSCFLGAFASLLIPRNVRNP